MSPWYVYTVGFIAQILFSGRLLLQWILSEKNKKVLTPSLFWKFSLIASFLLFVYGDLQDDFSIMLGQAITYYIYIRNLQLQGEWDKMKRIFQLFIYIFPAFVVLYNYNNGTLDLQRFFGNESIPIWLVLLGTVAQIIFNLRFLYQWIYSEKKKESLLPLGFWILSLIGASLILIYAIIRKDPVLFTGHIFGSVVYLRNIILSQKSKRQLNEA
ncbi:lipid-A-disaccharide synthase N-terminal domain-containing protein [Zunongwangia sp. SCSIO 43204]|uniref:lipid-A-disaccharide synthase N-terminal domain-containing protein n=1 Tax=Zunongwangia sp. SCSIO 43204 TaxID=2779359 RepID=UPI001CA9F467|nr:lipid-A-disaccharide synthase N-terminal domain-containing protein [Zunongwangia sp. SCSIO 43204]UAB86137.1 lipid-A-disaccharide synthase N-terminal domain-containing protein [Zunongwangia sp. SCSIO 43204]